mgnify:CR=1 FL=1
MVHCVKGTPGWELVPELREVPGTRFEKHTFGSRELADYAAVGRYDFVELVGLCTDICVISNAMLIKAAVPDTSIQVGLLRRYDSPEPPQCPQRHGDVPYRHCIDMKETAAVSRAGLRIRNKGDTQYE